MSKTIRCVCVASDLMVSSCSITNPTFAYSGEAKYLLNSSCGVRLWQLLL